MKQSRITIAICVIVIATIGLIASNVRTEAQNATSLSGWLWTSNAGWWSLNSTNAGNDGSAAYGVVIDQNNNLVGYAWSSNLGWLKFGGLTNFPTNGSPEIDAKIIDGIVVGWARACSGTVNGDCTGVSRTDGWDGWIELTGQNHESRYDSSTKLLSGYAWGEEVVGWLTFVGTTTTVAPTVDISNTTCFKNGESKTTFTVYGGGVGATAYEYQIQKTDGSYEAPVAITGGTATITWSSIGTKTFKVYPTNPAGFGGVAKVVQVTVANCGTLQAPAVTITGAAPCWQGNTATSNFQLSDVSGSAPAASYMYQITTGGSNTPVPITRGNPTSVTVTWTKSGGDTKVIEFWSLGAGETSGRTTKTITVAANCPNLDLRVESQYGQYTASGTAGGQPAKVRKNTPFKIIGISNQSGSFDRCIASVPPDANTTGWEGEVSGNSAISNLFNPTGGKSVTQNSTVTTYILRCFKSNDTDTTTFINVQAVNPSLIER